MNKKIEKYTEQLVQKEMNFDLGENDFGYVYPQGDVKDIDKLNKCLKIAGGKPKECELNDFGQGGKGQAKPEYSMTFNDDPNTILVIECKSQTRFHKTEKFNKPKSYAIDGVLYYAKFLKDEYNVIAIGVSGTSKEKFNLDVYYWHKGQDAPAQQTKFHNIFLDSINYLKAMKGEKISKSYSLNEIRTTAL